jgi:hypothetical protein
MSAGTRNFELGEPYPADRGAPPLPARSRPNEKIDGERLRVVRVDDSAFPTGNAMDATKSSSSSRRPLAEYLAQEHADDTLELEEEIEAKTLPSRESGVDLAALQSSAAEAAKLAAFMQELPPVKQDGMESASPLSPRKAVVMPRANTDLREIFQADQVCMVARPREKASSPATPVKPQCERAAAAESSIPPETHPQDLDQTQRYLVENWPKLPPNVQEAILYVIDAALSPDD